MNPLLVFLLCAGLLNETDPQRNGKVFEEYADEIVQQPPNDPVRVHRYSYKDRTSPISPTRHVSFVRTDNYPPAVEDQFVKTEWHYTDLHGNYPGSPPENEYVIDCYLPEGNEFQKPVYFYPPPGNEPYLKFAPGEMGPGMLIISDDDDDASPSSGYTQTIQLKKGWNLVSWHLNIPDPDWPADPLQMQEILPGPPDWLDGHGEVHKWDIRDLYYPDVAHPEYGQWEWDLDYAYYLLMDGPSTWQFTSQPSLVHGPIGMQPSEAWTYDPAVGDERVRWFFLGYSTPGYMKLASIPNTQQTASGNPAYFDYEGPLHWLIWLNEPENNYPQGDLKIIKTDDGKCYVPTPMAPSSPYDNIGVLEPGRGYFLGFYCRPEDTYNFDGWPDTPVWTNYSIESDPKASQSETAAAVHFQFTPFTHWFYPILIDTVDLEQTPLEVGDEIGVFDGDLCVGAVQYQGAFPLQLNAWEDDLATPATWDGYIAGQPMTFKWFDASQNTEAEFVLPAGTMAVEDDPVAPLHSGFGRGAYGRRSFCNGVQSVQQLPLAFKLGHNYPNPFNAETIIPLELPQRSQVKIELFNICGQNLGTIYEGVQNAGWPKVRYNAVGLASGVYIYRITAQGLENGGKFQNSGKMLVLK